MELICSPTLTQTLRSHRSEVTCADAAGARLVTGAGDRTLRLWRWERGDGWRETATAAAAHRYGVTTARWSHGGVLLASGGVDGAVRVWCGRSLAPRRMLAAPGATAVRALCWAAGARVLAGHDDGTLCVWLAARGVLLARLAAHEGALHAVAVLAHDRLSLTACTHGVLKVFNLVEVCRSEPGVPPAPLTWVDGAHDLGALCAAATASGDAAATGGHDSRICIWREAGEGGQRAGLTLTATLEGHAAAVTALCWAERSVLASASLDRTARLWAPDVGDCLHVVHAHPRYLTCVVLAPDLRYLITGSNDKSVRMWSLGALTLDDELEPPCPALAHFALGDLEGIGPVVEFDEHLSSDGIPGPEAVAVAEGSGATLVWRSQAHTGAINCLTAHKDLLATASSDGLVKVLRWSEETGELRAEHELQAHRYPVLAADFGAAGAVLLTAGLDGCAALWDVKSGVQLRSLSMPSGCGGGAGGGEAGGGGVRGARVSPHRPPQLLLATDDGLAPLWNLADADPRPGYVFGGHTEAVTCCAWSWDGRVVATGAASGELRLHAPPPTPATLHHCSHAHDLGVQSCDFAPRSCARGPPGETHLLATAGCDSLLRLWAVHLNEDLDGPSASVRLLRQMEAHGGAVASVRWGGGGGGGGGGSGTGVALLATAGADRWARVWRITDVGPTSVSIELVAAVPVAGAGGALAAAVVAGGVLAVGALTGELSLWRLPLADTSEEEEHAAPRVWSESGVVRWLREYVARPPGSSMSREEEAELLRRAKDAAVTGSRLLDDPVDELLYSFGYGDQIIADEDNQECKAELERAETRARLTEELEWLRRDAPPSELERSAPHALLCPLSHRLLREPARAADGFTYERANILDWFLAADGAVSPVSGRRLRNARLLPNYALRDALRAFLRDHAPDQ